MKVGQAHPTVITSILLNFTWLLLIFAPWRFCESLRAGLFSSFFSRQDAEAQKNLSHIITNFPRLPFPSAIKKAGPQGTGFDFGQARAVAAAL
jgi:hypothetical protein